MPNITTNHAITYTNIIALAQNLGFGTNSLLRIAPLLHLALNGCICDLGKALLWSAIFM